MQSFLRDTAVTLDIPLVTESGSILVATAVSYRVVDQDEVEKVALTAINGIDANTVQVTVTVPGAANNLPANVTRELRTIELRVSTASGVVILETSYYVEDSVPLIVAQNSYQTFGRAKLTAAEITDIHAWDEATDSDRVKALVQAWHNIGRLQFSYERDQDSQAYIGDRLWMPDSINDLTLAEFNALPTEFLVALRRAQVIEANSLLGGEESEGMRKEGLMSASVGEVSQMFRPGKPVRFSVSKRTLGELGAYVVLRFTCSR